jgi:hypothetical protein
LPPSSGPESKPNKKPELCLPPALIPVSCSAYSSTLNMEAICFTETSVDFQRTTRRYIPDGTLHNHRCENLESYIVSPSLWVFKLRCQYLDYIAMDDRMANE